MRWITIALLSLAIASDCLAQFGGPQWVRRRSVVFAPSSVSQPVDPWISLGAYAGRWTLNYTNTAGNFPDTSGNNLTATNVGSTFSSGIYTSTFGINYGGTMFDGIDDKLVIGDSDLLTMTNGVGDDAPFTVCSWDKRNRTVGTLFSKGSEDANTDEWGAHYSPNLVFSLIDKTAVTRNKYAEFKLGSVATNRWTFCCFVYDGKTNANIYMNYQLSPPGWGDNFTNLTMMSIATTIVNYVSMSNRAGAFQIGAIRGNIYPIGGEAHSVFVIRGTNLTISEAQFIMTNTIPTNYLFSVP